MEFVILLPVLMILLFGTFEISRLWLTVGVVAEAAREGARTSAMPTTTGAFDGSTGVTRITTVLTGSGLTAASTPTVTCTGATPCNAANCAPPTACTVTATVTVNFQTVVPILVPLMGATKPVQQVSKMRFEG